MRDLYYDQLDGIVDDLVSMASTVREAVLESTQALLNADQAAAEAVISGDKSVDEARELIEEQAFQLLATQQPVAGDLRMLVATLRMVADLERIGDLAGHVAKVARLRMPAVAVPPTLRETITTMASVAETMVDSAARILAERDVEAAADLEREDDQMDQLRRSLFRTLLSDEWSYGVEPAIDIALLGRYYERIGDHAVSMGRRVIYLVTGEHPVTVA
ncbi:MAG: phosphate signaling complex protein PhoU [Nocardioidaceae bacterium]|jgi:phosphate transport system protein|nr:phosphate signaling complex protein PhoU [Nocardioidaceae bacterium]